MSRSTLRMAGALVASALVGGLGATAANATFGDVSESNQFAEHITSVQSSGVATGFPDGSFRPTEPLNRQQAAAWIDRSMGRVGLDWYENGSASTVLDGGSPSAVLAEIEVDSPAAGSGGGWVTIQGGVGGGLIDAGDGCPCQLWVLVVDADDEIVGRTVLAVDEDGSVATAPLIAVVPLAAGETGTYRMVAELMNPDQSIGVGGAAYALYAPAAMGEPDQAGTESAPAQPADEIETIAPALRLGEPAAP